MFYHSYVACLAILQATTESSEWISEEFAKSERPELGSAKVIISGWSCESLEGGILLGAGAHIHFTITEPPGICRYLHADSPVLTLTKSGRNLLAVL